MYVLVSFEGNRPVVRRLNIWYNVSVRSADERMIPRRCQEGSGPRCSLCRQALSVMMVTAKEE